MKKLKEIIVMPLMVVVAFFVAVFQLLSSFKPREKENLNYTLRSGRRVKPGDELKIITWNLGYSGLGKECTFIYNGKGRGMIRPPSVEIVRKNLDGAKRFLSGSGADVILLQEVTSRSFMNYSVPMYDELNQALSGYNSAYSESIRITFPVSLIHGNALFTKYQPASIVRHALPLEKKGLTGLLSQKFNFVVARLDIAGSPYQWVIIDMHFAAFDEKGETRDRQLQHILQFVFDEYEKGNYVVVGGDWNLALVDTRFPYDTKEEYLFWKQDFPKQAKKHLEERGWKIAADSSTPSVRSLEKPYDGYNYTTIIDGYLCSPNVEIVEIKGINLGFEYSDHNPVLLRVRAPGNTQ